MTTHARDDEKATSDEDRPIDMKGQGDGLRQKPIPTWLLDLSHSEIQNAL